MKRTALVGLAIVAALTVTPTAALAGPPRGRPPAPRQHRPSIGWFFRWFGHEHGHFQPPAPPEHNRGRHNSGQRGRQGGWHEPGENGGHRGGGRGHGGR
jgi:hypothetical protein